jgi:WD40 repeat protein
MSPPGHVFISYAREDAERVDELAERLESAGVRVWKDTHSIDPGQDWRAEIRKAISEHTLVFLACFSRTGQAKDKSFQREELILACEQMRLRAPEKTWLIPVRFDDCTIPDYDLGTGRDLSSLNRADLFDDVWPSEVDRLVASVLALLTTAAVEPGPAEPFSASAEAGSRLTHGAAVVSVAFSPDGNRLFTASLDKTARVWDLTTGRQVACLPHVDAVTEMVLSPDGAWLATASGRKTAWVWDPATGKRLACLTHKIRVNGMVASPDGTRLVTGDDRRARVWDPITGEQSACIKHFNTVSDMAFSPDGTRLAVTSLGSFAKVYDPVTGQQVASLDHHSHQVFGVAFSPDGKQLATASDVGTAWVWDLATGRRTRVPRHAPVSRRILWLLGWSPPIVLGIAFSPYGTRLVTYCSDGSTRVWDPTTGEELACLVRDGFVNQVVFSPDGTKLAATCRNGMAALVWDLATGRQLPQLIHDGPVVGVAFSADGTQIGTGGADGTARVWTLPVVTSSQAAPARPAAGRAAGGARRRPR